MPIYIYILRNTSYFVTFPEVNTVRCLFLKCAGKIRKDRIFKNVRGCNIFSGVYTC